jgi:hypothetical protein
MITNKIDEYGQPQTTETEGVVKMAINLLNEAVSTNALYSDANYIGLTLNKEINDNYIIQYGEERLKVTHSNRNGRYNQVFLTKIQ